MFSDLFWSIYWIDILSGIGWNLVGSTFFGALATFLLVIYYDYGEPGPRLESVKKAVLYVGLPTFLLFVALSFIPSKQTMYVMLGVKTTQGVANSPIGQKLQTIVDAELDGYIQKLTSKKSKE